MISGFDPQKEYRKMYLDNPPKTESQPSGNFQDPEESKPKGGEIAGFSP